MKRILIVKVTSLGDVIQAQPVVSDIRRFFPDVKIDWITDSSCMEIVQWNKRIDRALHAPLRRFKKAPSWKDFKAIWSSIRQLRAEPYDVVIDIHGVYKSAIISFLARSRRRFGYLSKDLGEYGATFAYTDRFPRPHANAWCGMRQSVGQALGYLVDHPPQYNLEIPEETNCIQFENSKLTAILCHATSKDEKKWPIDQWIDVGTNLSNQGFRILIPWNSQAEHAEASKIAAQVPNSQVLPHLTITECAQLIKASDLVVGVDTGLVHMAHALEIPAVMIFTATSRAHFGINTPGRSISVGDKNASPSVEEVWAAIESVMPTSLQLPKKIINYAAFT